MEPSTTIEAMSQTPEGVALSVWCSCFASLAANCAREYLPTVMREAESNPGTSVKHCEPLRSILVHCDTVVQVSSVRCNQMPTLAATGALSHLVCCLMIRMFCPSLSFSAPTLYLPVYLFTYP